MTTPNLNTPFAIISDAYQDAGLLRQGQEPNSDQFVMALRRLSDMILLWQTKGLKLWLNVDTPVSLVAGQAAYTFTPGGDVDMTRPFRVLQGYWLSPLNIRTPLRVLSWQEYLQLSQVTGNNGALNSYFVNKGDLALTVYFWLTPDVTAAMGVAHVLLQCQAAQFTEVTDTMNFPIEWRMALRWGLADELATGQPQAIMDRCQQRAEAYRIALEDWDVEDAPTRFQPDSQQFMSSRSFT